MEFPKFENKTVLKAEELIAIGQFASKRARLYGAPGTAGLLPFSQTSSAIVSNSVTIEKQHFTVDRLCLRLATGELATADRLDLVLPEPFGTEHWLLAQMSELGHAEPTFAWWSTEGRREPPESAIGIWNGTTFSWTLPPLALASESGLWSGAQEAARQIGQFRNRWPGPYRTVNLTPYEATTCDALDDLADLLGLPSSTPNECLKAFADLHRAAARAIGSRYLCQQPQEGQSNPEQSLLNALSSIDVRAGLDTAIESHLQRHLGHLDPRAHQLPSHELLRTLIESLINDLNARDSGSALEKGLIYARGIGAPRRLARCSESGLPTVGIGITGAEANLREKYWLRLKNLAATTRWRWNTGGAFAILPRGRVVSDESAYGWLEFELTADKSHLTDRQLQLRIAAELSDQELANYVELR